MGNDSIFLNDNNQLIVDGKDNTQFQHMHQDNRSADVIP